MCQSALHDTLVDELFFNLRHEYDYIDRHIVLSVPKGNKGKRRRILAEIDILAKKGKEIHIFEVKSSYRIVKAKKQLRRIKKLLGENRAINMYFYYPGTEEAILIEE